MDLKSVVSLKEKFTKLRILVLLSALKNTVMSMALSLITTVSRCPKVIMCLILVEK